MAEIEKKEVKERRKIVPEEMIFDEFICEDERIAVLDNKLMKGLVEEDALVLVKLVPDKDGYELKSLTEEEYDKAYKKYQELLKLVEEDNG